MNNILDKRKGESICIIPSCDIEVAEYGYICEGHRSLAADDELKTIICNNCGSVARIVEPNYEQGEYRFFWRANRRNKYIFCEVCRNCGATREEEVYSTYSEN